MRRQASLDRERTYGGEAERMNLDTQGGHVLLLKFTSQVALDESGLDDRKHSSR